MSSTLDLERLKGVVNSLYVPNSRLDNLVDRPDISNGIWPEMPTAINRVNGDASNACVCIRDSKHGKSQIL